MKITQFLDQVYRNQMVPVSPVICFRGQRDYPLLFFSLLFNWLKAQKKLHVFSVAFDEQKRVPIKAQLETSFLGMSVLYWLRSMTEANCKEHRQWFSYLRTYQGPHTILFFTTQQIVSSLSKDAIIVDVPNTILRQELPVLQRLLHGTSATWGLSFIEQIPARYSQMPLDLACLLLWYALLIGKNRTSFFTEWFDDIMPVDCSLFSLSKSFFAKDARLFFMQWLRIRDKYNLQFWIVFWSEQLWRAGLYVTLANNSNYNEARKIQIKLPFSFVQRDWKKYRATELKNAHQFLCTIDYRVKNNGSPVFLDLFYSKFFLSTFS